MNVWFFKKIAEKVRDKLITSERKRANKLLDQFIREGKNEEEIIMEIARFETVIDISYKIFFKEWKKRFNK